MNDLESSHWFLSATRQYESNGNEYHNSEHVARVKAALETDDIAAEIAAHFHDVVFDNLPNKEFRSANMMVSAWEHSRSFDWNLSVPTEDIQRAYVMIMATSDHDYRNWPQYARHIIRADLADLAIPAKTVLNYGNLMRESMRLYEIDEKGFAKANIEFMSRLSDICASNQSIDQRDDFWRKVQRGIIKTIDMSNEILS